MTINAQDHIVVGVDGTPASDRGVEYAAAEAQRLGVTLHVLHASPGERASGPPLPIVPDGSVRTYALQLLDHAEQHARKVAPGIEVHTKLVPGGAVSTLVEQAKHATLLVVGAERHSLAGQLWTGDVVAGVSARALCPVVVVPPDWQPGEAKGRVVVGLKSVEGANHLLRAGLELADARGAELVVLNAWKLPSGYDDIVASRTEAEEWGRRQTGLIEPIVQDLRRDHHDVSVRIEVLHAQPAFALVRASADADRLIISRPKHGGAFHHLGPVARAVLREAHCPVEVLPPAPDESRSVS